jgi:hypothetical protein
MHVPASSRVTERHRPAGRRGFLSTRALARLPMCRVDYGLAGPSNGHDIRYAIPGHQPI